VILLQVLRGVQNNSKLALTRKIMLNPKIDIKRNKK